MPPLPGSPAINGGVNTTGVPTVDQRGVSRVGNVDIGAVESRGFTLAVNGGNNQSTIPTTVFANPLAVTVSSSFGEPVQGGLVTFTAPGSGPSATLTNPAALNASGQTSVNATANAIAGGPYQVTASANGLTAMSFNLSNTCPTITVGTPANTGLLGVSYSSSAAATPAVSAPLNYRYALANGTTLPPGLSLDVNSGAITGMPSALGPVTFKIRAELFNGMTATGCAVTSGDLSINITNPIITATATARDFRVVRNGANLEVRDITNSAFPGTVVFTAPYASLTSLTINGRTSDANRVVLDFGGSGTFANPIPSGGFTFNGDAINSGAVAGTDRLDVASAPTGNNATFSNVTVGYTDADSGTVAFTDITPTALGTATFHDLDELDLSGGAYNANYDFSVAVQNLVTNFAALSGPTAATLTDFGGTTDGVSRIVTTTGFPTQFVATNFPNPSNSLSLNTGAAASDTVQLGDVDNNFAPTLLNFTGDDTGDIYRLTSFDFLQGTFSGLTLTMATFDLNGFSDTLKWVADANDNTSQIALGSNAVLTTGDASNRSYNGLISGTGGFVKQGTGDWTLGGSGSNTYTGTATVNAGRLLLNKTAATALSGPLVIGNGDANDADVIRLLQSNQISDTSAVTVNTSGLLELNGNGDTLGGLLTLQSGTTFAGTVTTFGGVLTLATGGNVTLTPTGSGATPANINGSVSLAAGSHTFTIADGTSIVDGTGAANDTDLLINADLSGAGGIVKAGLGRLEVNNAGNDYAGLTQVNAGVFHLTGFLTGAGQGISLNGSTTVFSGGGSGALVGAGRGVTVTGSATNATIRDLIRITNTTAGATGVSVEAGAQVRIVNVSGSQTVDGISGHAVNLDVNGPASTTRVFLQGNRINGNGGNSIGLRVQGGAWVDAGQTTSVSDFTGLRLNLAAPASGNGSTGGNVFGQSAMVGYSDSATGHAIRNLNTTAPNNLAGVQGQPHDTFAQGNTFNGLSGAVNANAATIESLVYHDADAAGVGFVWASNCLTFTVGTPTETGTLGVPYSSSAAATPAVSAPLNYRYSLANSTTLPAGLSLDANSGAITGTPTASGQVTFKITAELFNDTTATGCAVTSSDLSINITCTNNPLVTNGNDSGAGSLREAIAIACPGSTITFANGINTVTLTSGELVINKNLTIQGPGANLLTVQRSTAQGTPDFRIFNINSGATVTLDRLTIANGRVSGTLVYGGGILNLGTLNLSYSTLSGNTASASNGGDSYSVGGGIHNEGDTVNLSYSTLSGNTASAGRNGYGGGINSFRGTVNITNSTLSGNTASASNGGNSSSIGAGGGINSSSSSTVNITNSTIFGNTASGSGSSNGNYGFGGGIAGSGTFKIRNTLIAGNSVTGADAEGPDVRGTFNSLGNNLIGKTDNSSGWVATDQTGTATNPLNPQLGPLANNGGPTQTMALLPGSPALNAGNNCVLDQSCTNDNLSFNLTTDQRGAGFPRQIGSAVDIGAFEANYALAATSGTPQSANVNTAFAQALQATLTESGNPVSGVALTFTANPAGNGASATLGMPNPATTDSNGQASVNATANGLTGSYQVTASSSAILTASFSLSNSCPTITAMVSGGGTICPTQIAQILVSVSGGQAPYTVTLTNGGGTQTGAGPFTFNVSPGGTTTYNVMSATDANGCPVTASGSALVTVNSATAINAPPTSQTRVIGQSVTFSVGASGTNLSYQWRKNQQPINGATQSSFTIGAVALADQGAYDVIVTGTCGMLTSSPATLTVACPTITLGALPQASAGVAYSAVLQASPAGGNYQFGSSDLPAWLSLAANGNLSGTPPATGTFNFTVSVTGFGGACQQSLPVSLTVVCPPLTLTPATLPNAEGGTPYSQQLAASPMSGNEVFSLTSGALPAGLTLSPTGLLGGTTTQTGVFNFRVSLSSFNGQCNAFRDYQLLVSGCAPVTLNPASLSNGTIGSGYNQTVTATPNGSYSFSVTSGALPPGVTLNAATGALSGTPNTGGTFNFRITAANGACSGARDYSVTINCATLTLGTLPNAAAGNVYNQTVSVTPAAPAGSYTFSVVQGNLPPGLILTPSTGAISGTPIVAGTYPFTIKAQTAGGCAGEQTYSLTVACPGISLSALATPTLNSPYNQTVTASPAGGSYSFTVTAGVLPAGLSLNAATGAISGTPTAAGAYNFTITATGFGACAGARNYTGTIEGGGCPTITLPDLPAGQPGQLYNQSLAATPSGTYSYAVTSGSLPPGLTLYGSLGMLFGYPTTTGTFNFTITASSLVGSNNCTGSKNYAVAISGGALALPTFGDFDGDGKADLSVWRGQSGEWLTINSSDGTLKTEAWGTNAAPYFDVMTPGDYDGDGKMDLAVFRKSTGQWLIKGSRDGAVTAKVWGVGTDTPVPGDYDGDGKTDLAVWRGAESNWYIQRSSDGQTETISWGTSRAPYRDVAVPADFDGDGKTDLAVFRQANGHWYIRQSSDGSVLDKAWGLGSDIPVAADYDGDGKADIAVWRGVDTNWYILRSSNGVVQTISWGTSTLKDVPSPGDYDGDGKADAAVWRASDSNWHIKGSRDEKVITQPHGQQGDVPVTVKSKP